MKKLAAFNGEYIRAMAPEAFAEACVPWLTAPYAPWKPEAYDAAAFATLAELAQTRLTVLSEITKYVDWYFLEETPEDEVSWTKAMKSGAEAIVKDCRERYAAVAEWDTELLKTVLEEVAAGHGLKLGKAQAPVRVAVTGRTVGLPLFESLELRERTLARLDVALAKLAG